MTAITVACREKINVAKRAICAVADAAALSEPVADAAAALLELRDAIDDGLRDVGRRRPTVVCLCGSTRFKDAFDEANYRETMAGRIVLSVGFFMHATGNRHGGGVGATPEQKVALDELHKRKIELADEILVLDVGGYVGPSTASEVEHAKALGKRVRWLERIAE